MKEKRIQSEYIEILSREKVNWARNCLMENTKIRKFEVSCFPCNLLCWPYGNSEATLGASLHDPHCRLPSFWALCLMGSRATYDEP